MAKVAASPLLVAGPPGWVAYALIAIGSSIAVGVTVNEVTKSRPATKVQAVPQTGTARRQCERPYSIRIHAQGMVIGGTRSSTAPGLPPILQMTPVLVAQGLVLSSGVLETLTRTQRNTLRPAKNRLDRYISSRPMQGGMPPATRKSFYPNGRADETGNRYDVDSDGCSNNFVG